MIIFIISRYIDE